MKNIIKFFFIFAVLLSCFVYADDTPPNPGSGGAGLPGTPGARAVAIDDYQYWLFIVAVFIIILVLQKYRARLSKI